MNLTKISELKNLISSLNGVLKKLKSRKENLLKEVLSVNGAQERLKATVGWAQTRVSGLGELGLRAEFLEEIIRPVKNIPDCSGIGTALDNEISGIDDQIKKTNSEIWWADEEKKRLEMEAVE